MSSNDAVEVEPRAQAVDLSTSAPTVTRYMELADAFLKAFDDLAAMVPKYQIKHAPTAAFVTANIGISLKCLNTGVDAVAQSPMLQGLNRFQIDEARDTLQFIDAFAKVLDKVDTFANGLRFTINSRRAVLASGVLQVYGAAKHLARNPDDAAIAVHAQNISRDLGRKGRHVAKKQQPGTPPSGGAPVPSSPTPGR